MNHFENEHGDQVQVEVHQQISELYMAAEKNRYIAAKSGYHNAEEYWAEVARRYEALALITAPPRYCFTSFHKFDGCTGPEYRLNILEEALKLEPYNIELEASINELKLLI